MALSKEELEKIEKEFAKEFERNPEKMIAQYRETFCKKVNYLCSDNALELCRAYKDAPKEHKAAIADSIGRTASGIIEGTFEQMLKENPKPGVENIVTFVAGGAGAGKTHFIKNNWASKEIVQQSSHIVFEVVGGLKEMNIERVLNAGKDALMLYIHRPIEKVAPAVLKRAEKEGRMPSFDYVCNGHLETQKQMQFLTQTYQHNQGVLAAVGDNSKGKDAKIIDPITRKTLEFLQSNAYKDNREIRDRAFKAVQNYIKGRERRGKPIDKELVKDYIGQEREIREKAAEQKRQHQDQEKEKSR